MTTQRYTVTVSREYETVAGFMAEEIALQESFQSAGKALIFAEETYKNRKEEYSSIYIEYAHRDSSCYYNPRVGHEPVGKNWICEFE